MTQPGGFNEPVSGARPAWTNDADLARQRRDVQLGILLGEFGGIATRWPPDPDAELQYLCHTTEILVRSEDLDEVLAATGGTRGEPPMPGLEVVVLAEPEAREETLARLDTANRTGIATPNHIFYVTPGAGCCPATEPNLTEATRPHPPLSRQIGCTGAGVNVAVVDTGFIFTVTDPWLAGITGDAETIYDKTNIRPYVGHGTFVAGVVRSMAPRAQVDVQGFLTRGGAILESHMIRQLYEATLQRARPNVISMSAGSYTRNQQPSIGFEVFWEYLRVALPGTIVVSAAGNDNTDEPFWPAAADWCVGVGALDPDGNRAAYSNYGPWVDVYALGTDVINAFPNGYLVYHEPPRVGHAVTFTNQMASWSGTSFATPLVAGLIAARMSSTLQNGHDAWSSLHALAHDTDVGKVLEPGMACLTVPS